MISLCVEMAIPEIYYIMQVTKQSFSIGVVTQVGYPRATPVAQKPEAGASGEVASHENTPRTNRGGRKSAARLAWSTWKPAIISCDGTGFCWNWHFPLPTQQAMEMNATSPRNQRGFCKYISVGRRSSFSPRFEVWRRKKSSFLTDDSCHTSRYIVCTKLS